MDEKMKEALLACCERHTAVLSDATVDFAFDLAKTYVKATPNILDDTCIPILTAAQPVIQGLIKDLVDKISDEPLEK